MREIARIPFADLAGSETIVAETLARLRSAGTLSEDGDYEFWFHPETRDLLIRVAE